MGRKLGTLDPRAKVFILATQQQVEDLRVDIESEKVKTRKAEEELIRHQKKLEEHAKAIDNLENNAVEDVILVHGYVHHPPNKPLKPVIRKFFTDILGLTTEESERITSTISVLHWFGPPNSEKPCPIRAKLQDGEARMKLLSKQTSDALKNYQREHGVRFSVTRQYTSAQKQKNAAYNTVFTKYLEFAKGDTSKVKREPRQHIRIGSTIKHYSDFHKDPKIEFPAGL